MWLVTRQGESFSLDGTIIHSHPNEAARRLCLGIRRVGFRDRSEHQCHLRSFCNYELPKSATNLAFGTECNEAHERFHEACDFREAYENIRPTRSSVNSLAMSPDDVFVTIGVPTYNNARTIRRALDSVRAQSYTQWRLIISDDGSKDDTVSIAQKYAQEDSRITVVSQPTNLNYGNFRYLVGRATTPYFAFLAGDDWMEPDFLEEALLVLVAAPEVVAAVPGVLMHPEGKEPYRSPATKSLEGSAEERFASYIRDPGDNSRMYGLFRTEVARKSFPDRNYHAYDWTFSARSLLHGTHRQLPRVLLHREVTSFRNYLEYARRDSKVWLFQIFPVLQMTLDLGREQRIRSSTSSLRALASLNWMKHEQIVSEFYPNWGRIYRVLRRACRSLFS